jgi:two-component system, chemotaxis family, protein-glutamate methylesterase/glutaminase
VKVEVNDPLTSTGQELEGPIVPWSCPECSGTLWETASEPTVQFRCRVRHAYSEESFLKEHLATIERTLWAAIRLLEERAAAQEYLAEHASKGEGLTQATALRKEAEESRSRAKEVRRVIENL